MRYVLTSGRPCFLGHGSSGALRQFRAPGHRAGTLSRAPAAGARVRFLTMHRLRRVGCTTPGRAAATRAASLSSHTSITMWSPVLDPARPSEGNPNNMSGLMCAQDGGKEQLQSAQTSKRPRYPALPVTIAKLGLMKDVPVPLPLQRWPRCKLSSNASA